MRPSVMASASASGSNSALRLTLTQSWLGLQWLSRRSLIQPLNRVA